MPSRDLPGAFEQMVLLALLRLKEDAYGMTVRRQIESRTGRAVTLGAVYATLGRLETKGYVVSRLVDPCRPATTRDRRARRFFAVQPAGLAALQESLQALDQLRRGLPRRARPAGGG